MVRISQVTADRATATRDYGDAGTLSVTNRPRAVTPSTTDGLLAVLGDGRVDRFHAEYLLAVVVEWDLEDDEGNVIPLTAESLAEVPSAVLAEVVETIREHLNPGEAESSSVAG